MNIHPILGATALVAALSLTSCLSFDTHDDRPASTTTVTRETVVPDPLLNPGVTQTTETTETTTTTRTR